MKHRLTRRISLLLLVALLLFSFVGCSGMAARPSSNAKRVVATAGDVEITYDELYYLANTRIAEIREEQGEDALSDPAVVAELERFVQQNLCTRTHFLLALAAEYDIYIDKGELADSLDTRIRTIIDEEFEGDRAAYIESLNEAYLTERYVRTYIASVDFLPSLIVREMLERGELSDSDETARAFIEGDDLIRVSQVLIERRNYASAEEARAKAEELRAKVVAQSDPAKRAEAMRSAMQFSTYIDEGYGLYFARGEMQQSFESAAFALEEYGVSEVLELDGDYYFLMRMPKEQSYITEHFEVLKQKSYFIEMNRRIEQDYAFYALEMTDYGASLDLTDLPAIDADGGETLIKVLLIGGGVVLIGGVFFVARFAFLRHRAKHHGAAKGKKA